MNNTVAQDRAHKRRSEEQCRLDKMTRQLLHKTEAFGLYVRLYYLEEDDSFFLEWRLPDLSFGEKYFVNVDDCYFSLRYCVEAIAEHCDKFDFRLPVTSTATLTRCRTPRRL